MRGKVTTREAAHRARLARHLPDDAIFWIAWVLLGAVMWWVLTRPESSAHYWAFLTSALLLAGGVYDFRRKRRRLLHADRPPARLVSVGPGAGLGQGGWHSVVELTMPDGSLQRMPLHSSVKPREPLEVAMLPEGLVFVSKLEQAEVATLAWLMSGLLLAYGVVSLFE